ncbi:hypothetical protein V8G54_023787 [Vigna mungo]|uniref:Uncharacterized protein n=1 Tax=Vigna mungo TaxID=3915 RepID=A0AAQ3N5K7_VIGMU
MFNASYFSNLDKDSPSIFDLSLAFLEASCTLSLKCFSSPEAPGAMGLGCGPPKDWSSDVFPAETPRTLLSSPVYFLLPTVIESSGKHCGKGGISEEVIPLLLLLFKLFPELNIKLSTSLKLRRQVKRNTFFCTARSN